MRDPRLVKFAEVITGYSVDVQPGENVLIEMIGINDPEFLKVLIEKVYEKGGNPFYNIKDPRVNRAFLKGANEEQLKKTNGLLYSSSWRRQHYGTCRCSI